MSIRARRYAACAVGLIAVVGLRATYASAAPFAAGETLAYGFYWNGVPVGNITGRVRPGPTADVLKFEAKGGTNAVIDKLYKVRVNGATEADAKSLLPLRQSFYQQEGHRRKLCAIEFDRAKGKAISTRKRIDKVKNRTSVFNNVALAYDAFSAFYAARTRKLKPGQTATIDVIHGKGFYRVAAKVGAPKTVSVKAGKFNAMCLTIKPKRIQPPEKPDSKWPTILVWVTTDAHHVPVRMQIKTRWATVTGELMRLWAPSKDQAK